MNRLENLHRKFIIIVLLTLLFLVALGVDSWAVASSTTTVEVGSLSLYPGETGKLPIKVKDIPADGGLGAYDIEITFNPSVIQVLDIIGGDSPFNGIASKNIDNNGGKVRFNSFISSTQGPTGTITIAYLKVKAVGKAGQSCSLTPEKISLVNASSGDEITPRSTSPGSVTIKTPRSSSSISIAFSKNTVKIDEAIMISGNISPALSATVTLTFTRPDGSNLIEMTRSNSDGSYTYNFTPDIAGIWSVNASWPGDSGHLGATSPTKTFIVTKLNTTLTISLTPSHVVPGGYIKIEGSLTPSISDVTITIEYRHKGGRWIKVIDIVANETGGYSYNWTMTPIEPGGYEIKALWQGNDKYRGSQSDIMEFNVLEKSILSIDISCNSTSVNNQIVIRGQVSPRREYVNITIMIRTPNNTIISKTVQTDAAGNYKLSFTPDVVGEWDFKATWKGETGILGCESREVKLIVTTTGSTISLQVSRSTITIGDSIEFSGDIKPSPGSTSVTLILTMPNSTVISLRTTTTGKGSFSITYTPDQVGTWIVQASWSGNINYAGSTSLQIFFTVQKKRSSISLYSDPPIPKKDDLVAFKGILTPSISGKTINILISEDNGRTWSIIASCITTGKGEYSASWRVNKIGTFIFKAEWEGNTEYMGCSSTITLVIEEEVKTLKINLPGNQSAKTLFSTNSSNVTLAVDAKKGEIEANVTGQTGTTGVMNIFIPKNLLKEYNLTINDLLFTVDKVPVTPEITEVLNGYLATVHYHHSKRALSIYYLTYPLTVTVLDYNGQSVINAEVVVNGPIRVDNLTNSSGIAYFSHLPKGEYRIDVYYGPLVGKHAINLTNAEVVVTIHTDVGKLKTQFANLTTMYKDLESQFNNLTLVHEKLKTQFANLTTMYKDLESQFNNLTLVHEKLKTQFAKTSMMLYIFTATTIVFIATTVYFMRKKPA